MNLSANRQSSYAVMMAAKRERELGVGGMYASKTGRCGHRQHAMPAVNAKSPAVFIDHCGTSGQSGIPIPICLSYYFSLIMFSFIMLFSLPTSTMPVRQSETMASFASSNQRPFRTSMNVGYEKYITIPQESQIIMKTENENPASLPVSFAQHPRIFRLIPCRSSSTNDCSTLGISAHQIVHHVNRGLRIDAGDGVNRGHGQTTSHHILETHFESPPFVFISSYMDNVSICQHHPQAYRRVEPSPRRPSIISLAATGVMRVMASSSLVLAKPRMISLNAMSYHLPTCRHACFQCG